MKNTRLLFVYNADSGLFNTLTDIAHKAFSPSTYNCNLCAITHDLLKEKGEWKNFVASLGIDTEFLHKDEFNSKYGEHADSFPAIYLIDENTMNLAVTADELNVMSGIEQLKNKVSSIV